MTKLEIDRALITRVEHVVNTQTSCILFGARVELEKDITEPYYTGFGMGISFMGGETAYFGTQSLENIWHNFEQRTDSESKAVFMAGLSLAFRIAGDQPLAAFSILLYSANIKTLSEKNLERGRAVMEQIYGLEQHLVDHGIIVNEQTMHFQFTPRARDIRRQIAGH